MPSLGTRLHWYAWMLRDLVRARAVFRRKRDWLALVAVYGAHTVAGVLGMRTIRCHVPLPDDSRSVAIRLGTADFHAVKEVYLDRVYEFAMPTLAALMPSAPVVVDLGANIGLTVRLWSRRFSPRTIVAVEPDSDNAALCALNADVAVTTDLRMFQCFVAEAAGTAGIDRELGTWAYRMDRSGRGTDREIIAVRTVPDILGEAGLASAQIDLLKCDIEGAEAVVFRGGPEWLSRVRAVLAEVHDPYTAQALVGDVQTSGGHWDATVSGPAVLLVRR
jgi:FkbM family methyltransferase